MAINLGELEQVIRDVGGDDVLKKMAMIDEVATKLGAKPITIGIATPNTDAVTKAITQAVSKAQQVAINMPSTFSTGAGAMFQPQSMQVSAQFLQAAQANTQLAGSHQKAAQGATQQAQATNQATQKVQQFTTSVTKADGSLSAFGKKSITTLNGVAFAFSQMAASGDVSLRSIAGSATGILSFFGPKGAAAAIGSTLGLAIFDVVKANQKRVLELRATESAAANRSELIQRKAALEALEAAEKAGYDVGAKSLDAYYAKRAAIIQSRTAAEVQAREKDADALERKASDLEKFTQIAGRDILPDALRSSNIQQVAELRIQAKSLREEAQAVATAGGAELTRNTAERANAEKQLAEQVLKFENQRREALGQTHDARMAEIAQEAAAFAKLPLREGETVAQRAASVQAFKDALTAQANFEEGERRIGIITDDLANKREAINAQVERGQISQLEGERRIAAEERRRKDEIEGIAKAMLALGMALNNPAMISGANEILASLDNMGNFLDTFQRRVKASLDALDQTAPEVAAKIRAELKEIEENGGTIGIGFVIKTETIAQAAASVQAELEGFAGNIANTVSTSLAAGFTSAFTKGSGKNFFEALGNSLLAGVGGIIVQLGSAMLTYGLIMAAFAPVGLATPFAGYALSAPASIAAGTALIALGTGLGAIAANNSGSRTGGGAATSFAAPNRDTVQHIWLDPDRHLTRRAEDTATAITRAGTDQAKPMPIVQFNPTIIGENDPRAQSQLAALMTNAVRAGYEVG